MIKNIVLFIILLFFSSKSLSNTTKDFTNKQLLCPKQLWGFEFVTSEKIRVIETDLNNKTKITEYYYEFDLELSYINIFSSKNNIWDRVYSIELNSLRVDVWTMTGGGFTTREMFPMGLCKFIIVDNLLSYINNLK